MISMADPPHLHGHYHTIISQGGAMSIAAAANIPDISAAVPFYGSFACLISSY